jgi:hypothetical protein
MGWEELGGLALQFRPYTLQKNPQPLCCVRGREVSLLFLFPSCKFSSHSLLKTVIKQYTDKPWTDKPWTQQTLDRQTLDTTNPGQTNPGHNKPWTEKPGHDKP